MDPSAGSNRFRPRISPTSGRCARGRAEPQPHRNSGVFPLTSNLRWESAPGNVALAARLTGLPKDSVANVSLIVTVDKEVLTERVGRLPRAKLQLILAGVDVVLGR